MAYDEKIKRAYTASIHFKKSIAINAEHNDRLKPPSYLISHDDKDCEFNHNSHKAKELKKQIIENAKEQYTKRTGQKLQAKSYEWSAVCNIKPDTTMQDLEKLAEHFSKKYGFQCYQIAIHRDEGHFNEQGEKVINHHAHLEFITLDRETGKNNYNRQRISPSVLRQIQTEVAEILQMERGQDRRKSKTKRIEPRKYAQMKEAEKREKKELKQELRKETAQNADLQAELIATKKELESAKSDTLSQKELKTQIEAFRKDCIGKGYPKEFFRDLSALKQSKEPTTQEILQETLGGLVKLYEKTEQKNKELEYYLAKSNQEIKRLNAEKQKSNDLPSQTNKNDFRAISDDLNDTNAKPQMQNYSNDIIKACLYALNSHFFNSIYDSLRKKVKQAVSEKKKQESLEIFESRAKALQEVSKEKFSEWKQEHSNYKEILENFKNTPAQQQRTQGRSL